MRAQPVQCFASAAAAAIVTGDHQDGESRSHTHSGTVARASFRLFGMG